MSRSSRARGADCAATRSSSSARRSSCSSSCSRSSRRCIAPHDPAVGSCSTRSDHSRNPIPGPGGRLPARRRHPRPRLPLAPAGRQPPDPHRRRLSPPCSASSAASMLGIIAGAFGGWIDTFVMRIVDVHALDPVAAAGDRRSRRWPAAPSQWTVIVAVAVVADPDLRPAAARLDARPAVERPRAGRPRAGRQAVAHRVPAHAAQLARPGHRAGDPRARRRPSSTRRRCPSSASATPTTTPPEWGQMLGAVAGATSRTTRISRSTPRSCIIIVALGFTLMGESLREALDPKSRR